VDTVVCAPDDGWKYHPKHVEQFPDINKLCNVTSFWIYEYIEILLEALPILYISRIRVKRQKKRKIVVKMIINQLYIRQVSDSNLSSENGLILPEVLLGPYIQISK
jgi:hypothetical protein